MSIKNKLDKYLIDDNYKIIYYNNKLNVNNYLEILDFSSEVIKIKHKNGISNIYGNNLCVSKMIDNEILIEGNIKTISLS